MEVAASFHPETLVWRQLDSILESSAWIRVQSGAGAQTNQDAVS